MNKRIDTLTFRFDEKTLFFPLNSLTLFFIVLLSYYNLSHCYQKIKTFSYCLIAMTYYHATTHRRIYMAQLSPTDREDFIRYQISLEEYFQAKAKAKAKKKSKTKQRRKS